MPDCHIGIGTEYSQHLSIAAAVRIYDSGKCDVNPYGVAFAPSKVPAGGILKAGDILVSNFNDSQNLQGTGTTIVRVDKTGATSTFFTSPARQSGVSAAIGILSNGIVLIGNLPTINGTAATVQPGGWPF